MATILKAFRFALEPTQAQDAVWRKRSECGGGGVDDDRVASLLDFRVILALIFGVDFW